MEEVVVVSYQMMLCLAALMEIQKGMKQIKVDRPTPKGTKVTYGKMSEEEKDDYVSQFAKNNSQMFLTWLEARGYKTKMEQEQC